MLVLITGGQGFIAREIKPILEQAGLNVISPSRLELNVFDKKNVTEYFQDKVFDLVIHTAVMGGRRTFEDSPETVMYNWVMFQNLVEEMDKGHILKMIHLGSGAAFDRQVNIYNYTSERLGESIPRDYYGLSKFLIENYILHCHKNIINLRVFGCFGFSEQTDRFIHGNLLKLIKGEKLEVFADKYMDFIFVEDLAQLILNILEGGIIEKDINACYDQKLKLSEIALIISSFSENAVTINIGQKTKNYCGMSKLKNLLLDKNFQGLEMGIEKFYNKLK